MRLDIDEHHVIERKIGRWREVEGNFDDDSRSGRYPGWRSGCPWPFEAAFYPSYAKLFQLHTTDRENKAILNIDPFIHHLPSLYHLVLLISSPKQQLEFQNSPPHTTINPPPPSPSSSPPQITKSNLTNPADKHKQNHNLNQSTKPRKDAVHQLPLLPLQLQIQFLHPLLPQVRHRHGTPSKRVLRDENLRTEG